MKKILAFMLCLLSCSLAANPFVGQWKTIDDNTGEARSIIDITLVEGELRGRIIKLLNPSEPNPVCDKCSGDKKDAPIEGLEILWGFEETRENKEWSGGRIIDPENGRTYSCRLRIKEDGQQLEVRGFIGLSLIGRSQTWHRVND